jgi:hypothetical protein
VSKIILVPPNELGANLRTAGMAGDGLGKLFFRQDFSSPHYDRQDSVSQKQGQQKQKASIKIASELEKKCKIYCPKAGYVQHTSPISLYTTIFQNPNQINRFFRR